MEREKRGLSSHWQRVEEVNPGEWRPYIAPTASKQTGNFADQILNAPRKVGRFAGEALATAAPFANILFAGFDVASLLNSDQQGKDRAREMAINLVNQGYTDYDEIMALAQKNAGLESAIGDIGASDYTKTAAGIGLQAGDILMAGGVGAAAGSVGGPIGAGIGGAIGMGTALIGSLAQVDLQRKKAKRNEAFREQFTNELIQRGMVK
jgi:hypothetical protein